MTRLLRDTMEDWADEARVPHDLADRALRRRSWKPVGAAVLVAAMIAVVAVFVSGQREPTAVVRPAAGVTLPARPSPAPSDVRADTENSPPAKLIAAGRMAVSAYYTTSREVVSENEERVRRAWSLYDPRTDGYERTPYAWVDVAPGLQVAAVLEGDLTSTRLGVLDMNTRQILTWIDLEHPVASVAWSPDGTRILATAYSRYPDLLEGRGDQAGPRMDGSPRTGYYLIDVQEGTTDYHELPPLPGGLMTDDPITNMNGRQDLGWSLDGKLIWGPTSTAPDRVFYTLAGERQEAPEGQRYVRRSPISATSPDGRLVLGGDGLPTEITEAATGKVAGRQKVLQLHAWADDGNVIALGCAGKCPDEFDNGLVLVSVDGSKVVQLAANGESNREGSWRAVLTLR
ncbi:hypothetical protein GCM10022419_026090 [Nonomuraea rosea]|uniref:WD40 repeat domain-containing protein n=1 Tax=Nonomuraea rosea TaxID=638574 RepID=A0ABP6W4E1_9ACTN